LRLPWLLPRSLQCCYERGARPEEGGERATMEGVLNGVLQHLNTPLLLLLLSPHSCYPCPLLLLLLLLFQLQLQHQLIQHQ